MSPLVRPRPRSLASLTASGDKLAPRRADELGRAEAGGMIFNWEREAAPASAISKEEGGGGAPRGDCGSEEELMDEMSEWGEKRQKVVSGRRSQSHGDPGSSPLLPSGMSGDGSLIGAMAEGMSKIRGTQGGRHGGEGGSGLGAVDPSGFDDAWPNISVQLNAVGGDDQLLHAMGCDIFGPLSPSPRGSPTCNPRAEDTQAQDNDQDDAEGADNEVEKRISTLIEGIRRSQALKEKALNGVALTPSQQACVAQIDQMEIELEQLRNSGLLHQKGGKPSSSGARGVGRGLGDDGGKRGRKRGRGPKGGAAPSVAQTRDTNASEIAHTQYNYKLATQGFLGSWSSSRLPEVGDNEENMAHEHHGISTDEHQGSVPRPSGIAVPLLPPNWIPSHGSLQTPNNGVPPQLISAPSSYGSNYGVGGGGGGGSGESNTDRLLQVVQQLAMKIRQMLSPVTELQVAGGMIENLRTAVLSFAQNEFQGASLAPEMCLRVQYNLRARLKDLDQIVSSLVQNSKDLTNAIFALSQPHVSLSALSGASGNQHQNMVGQMVGSNYLNGARPDLHSNMQPRLADQPQQNPQQQQQQQQHQLQHHHQQLQQQGNMQDAQLQTSLMMAVAQGNAPAAACLHSYPPSVSSHRGGDGWAPDKCGDSANFSDDVDTQRAKMSSGGMDSSLPSASNGSQQPSGVGMVCGCSGSSSGYQTNPSGMSAHLALSNKQPSLPPSHSQHPQFQAQMMQQHMPHMQQMQYLGQHPAACSQSPSHLSPVTPVQVHQLVPPVAGGLQTPVVQSGVPVQSLQQVQQVQQALKQQQQVAIPPNAAGPQSQRPPPPTAQVAHTAQTTQPSGQPQTGHASGQQQPGAPSRAQASKHGSAREIVLRCTNCKRMLQLPPTNLEELRQVQCGACTQLMDVTGPPSIPQC